MRSGVLWVSAASFTIAALTMPAPSDATSLCKTKKGGLVIRETCKKKEVQVDAAMLGELGLVGPAGPQGPAGPAGPGGSAGPSGGGLSVVDASGRDVGIVASIGFGYYGGTFTNVLREMTAGGASSSEFFHFGVNYNGFATFDDYYSYYGTFATSNCTGTEYAYVDCEYGACDVPPMFHSLSIDSDLMATFSRPGERVHGNYFSRYQISSASADIITANCTAQGGTIVGTIAACENSPNNLCGLCCSPENDIDAAPLYSIDLSTLGLTPPFKLRR
jgi:hypothetical protein